MKNRNRLTIGLMLVLLSSAPLMAEEIICRGSLGRITVDNLLVPTNATCNLNGTRVLGTIKVANNATLTAREILVIGNIQAENAMQVTVLDGSRVGGSIQVKQGGGATVSNSIVDADIQYDSNSSSLQALNNHVGGNVQIFQNFGGAAVFSNVIDGNLQCKENFPVPVGGGNVVRGSQEDQCRQLSGSIASAARCARTVPLRAQDFSLQIPRVRVVTQNGIVDYWAVLRTAPELSPSGSMVLELQSYGVCN